MSEYYNGGEPESIFLNHLRVKRGMSPISTPKTVPDSANRNAKPSKIDLGKIDGLMGGLHNMRGEKLAGLKPIGESVTKRFPEGLFKVSASTVSVPKAQTTD